MAVAYVNVYTTDDTNGGATNTVTGVNGAAGNFVLALVSYRRNDGDETCTGVTYDGTPMTPVAAVQLTNDGTAGAHAFYYPNPTGTSVSVVASFDGATPPGNHQMSVLVFSGVDASGTPIGTVADYTGAAAATVSNTVSSTTDGMVAELFISRNGNPGATAGQTVVASLDASSAIDHRAATQPGATTVTCSWENSPTANLNWAQVLIPLNAESAGGPSFIPRAMLLGVG